MVPVQPAGVTRLFGGGGGGEIRTLDSEVPMQMKQERVQSPFMSAEPGIRHVEDVEGNAYSHKN